MKYYELFKLPRDSPEKSPAMQLADCLSGDTIEFAIRKRDDSLHCYCGVEKTYPEAIVTSCFTDYSPVDHVPSGRYRALLLKDIRATWESVQNKWSVEPRLIIPQITGDLQREYSLLYRMPDGAGIRTFIRKGSALDELSCRMIRDRYTNYIYEPFFHACLCCEANDIDTLNIITRVFSSKYNMLVTQPSKCSSDYRMIVRSVRPLAIERVMMNRLPEIDPGVFTIASASELQRLTSVNGLEKYMQQSQYDC